MDRVQIKFDNVEVGDEIRIGDTPFNLAQDKVANEVAGETVFTLEYATAEHTLTITKDAGGPMPPWDLSRLLSPRNAKFISRRKGGNQCDT